MTLICNIYCLFELKIKHFNTFFIFIFYRILKYKHIQQWFQLDSLE